MSFRETSRGAAPWRRIELKSAQNEGGENLHLSLSTSVADYVWLPIRFEGAQVILDWRDAWSLEDHA